MIVWFVTPNMPMLINKDVFELRQNDVQHFIELFVRDVCWAVVSGPLWMWIVCWAVSNERGIALCPRRHVSGKIKLWNDTDTVWCVVQCVREKKASQRERGKGKEEREERREERMSTEKREREKNENSFFLCRPTKK